MRFIHVADIHASRERLPQTLSILRTLAERAMEFDIDFIIFAGDFWDSTITATKGSGFSDIITEIRRLSEITNLYFIYGTPSHEPSGSLDAFSSSAVNVIDSMCVINTILCRIACIPEPRRSEYITDSIQKTNDLINKTIKTWIGETVNIHEKSKEYLPVLDSYEYDKPLIVVYHGEVKGAVYQNGVSASSPTAISKELLQSLNADYYALGHIHMPQEVFPNAWYPGSACPKNFGEVHDGHYNLVTIEDGKTKVEQISFGLPTYVTFYQRPDNFIEGNPRQNEKTNFRFIFDCTKEERKQMNLKAYVDETKERLGALSVKIEPNVIEGDSVQTSEVSKRKSLVEKMTAYAKEKGLKIPKYAKDILQDIQDGTLGKLAFPQHSFELLSLSLRGAIGIRDGQGKEDIDLNFEKYEDGVICLVGHNGAGKCVVGDSIILTDKGFEAIGSYDNKLRGFQKFKKLLYSEKNKAAISSHFYSEEVDKTIKITNSLGMELEGTEEHPVLIFDKNCTYKYKKLSEISIGDYVCIPRNMNVFPKEHYKFDYNQHQDPRSKKISLPMEMSVDLAKFIGYYIANGSHTLGVIQFSTFNEQIGMDYTNIVSSLFSVNVVRSNPNLSNYRIFSRVLVRYLEYIFGGPLTTGRYKTIPNCILQGTKEEQTAFLTALFDCDGSLSKNTFEYLSASKQIVVCLQNMLLNLGIISYHRTKKVKGYNWTYHRLTIGSLGVDNLFYRIFTNSLKYKYVRTVNANTNIDVIPYITKKFYKDVKRKHNGYIVSRDGKCYRNPIGTNLLQPNNNISYAKLETLISLCLNCDCPEIIDFKNLCLDISKHFYFFSEIKTIEHINETKTVYDFSIPNEHKFYSNGYISHNSTLVENCHPYPKMLSRKGTLQDHFYLKDSHRILIYKDENGLYYRISMLIDGKTANGKVAYFVETSKNRETWKSVPDVDGSSDAYKEWVNNTFGTIDVYLRTAFFAKEQTKDATDISDTTKGERMEFLSKLAGTEQLKEVSVIARENRKELEENSFEIEAEINAYSQHEETIKENEHDIKKWNNELKSQEKSISILEKEIKDLKLADAEYQKSVALAESNKALYEQYQNQKEELLGQSLMLDKAIGCYNDVCKLSEKKNLLAESNKRIPETQKNIAAKRKEIESVETEISKINKEREQMSKKFNQLDTEIKLVKQQIVPISDICPTCGGKLSAEKYTELTSVVKDNESKLHKLIAEQNKYVIPEEDEDWTLTPLINKRNTLKEELGTLECALTVLIDTVTDCNTFIDKWSEFEQFADKSKDDLEREANKLQAQLQEIDSKLDDVVYDACVQDVSEKLKETEEKLKREINRKADITASIKSAEKENERYQKELKSIEDKKAELKELQNKMIAYDFIEDTFSNKGIPAIELRESAPEIADIANKILKDSYGNKFEVRFGSTSELKAKKKADEDFNIIVTDTENFDEKTIDLVSSGERIWIKQALFYAFSIVQMNRTGFNFRTRLIDESDGSLDGTLRPKYLKMVEAAHNISNSRITILITHSQEIKDIAQQIIEI